MAGALRLTGQSTKRRPAWSNAVPSSCAVSGPHVDMSIIRPPGTSPARTPCSGSRATEATWAGLGRNVMTRSDERASVAGSGAVLAPAAAMSSTAPGLMSWQQTGNPSASRLVTRA
jgi:hypothetical protein